MVLEFLGLPMVNFSGITCALAGIVAALLHFARRSQGPGLDALPTAGSTCSWLGSWWAGLKNLINFADVVQEGYDKYKTAPFKVSQPCRWIVVIANRNHVTELSRAPNDVFSLTKAISEELSTDYTFGPSEMDHVSHLIEAIRSNLTRSIGRLYSDIKDEIVTSFDEVLDLKGNDWKSVRAVEAIEKIVCRTSNRIFVGLPLCRDPEWIDLNINFTINIVKEGILVGLFPKFIRHLAAWFLARGTRRATARALKRLGPVVEQRLNSFIERGNEWDEIQSDIVSWLIEEAGSQFSLKRYASQILLVNLAAIHTTSNSLTIALLFLAAHPQHILTLRDEVEWVIEREGWSKDAIGKMPKVDSFLRECQRLEGANSLGLIRKAMKDFVFSDGTFIPKGTLVGVAAQTLHHDDNIHKNANTFEPFRFVQLGVSPDGENVQRPFVTTGTDFLPFGHGKHACPGRFFAATQMKSIFAHVLVTYDIKLEDAATPRSLQRGSVVVANPQARLLFKKRFNQA